MSSSVDSCEGVAPSLNVDELNDDAVRLILEFDLCQDLSVIDKAIDTFQKVTALTPPTQPERATRLTNLGVALKRRFKSTGTLSDLTEAISAQEEAVRLSPEGSVRNPILLGNLGNSLRLRFDNAGDPVDIAQAIDVLQMAVDVCPAISPQLPNWLHNLGAAYTCRFKRYGTLEDVEKAISIQRRVLSIAEGDELDPSPSHLSNLASSLICRFERTGSSADIAESVSLLQRAVHVAGSDDPDLTSILNNLGDAFLCRFERNGDPFDLDEAVSAYVRAVDLTPDGSIALSLRLNNLGNALLVRFEHANVLSDIDAAVRTFQMAEEETPRGHIDIQSHLTNLASAYQARFERTRNPPDIAEAVEQQQKAIDMTPAGDINLPLMLNNLSSSLRLRFDSTHEFSDLLEAISKQETAIEMTGEGYANRPLMFGNLGDAWKRKFAVTGAREDLDACIRSYKTGAICTVGLPRHRLQAAMNWAQALDQHDPESLDILPAYDSAIRLLAVIAGLDQSIRLRFYQIGGAPGIALDAAAAACRLGNPAKAVEWLEQGRCVVWNQLGNLRSPIDELRAYDKTLADSVVEVASRLEGGRLLVRGSRISMTVEEKVSLEKDSFARLELASEWDALLARARSLPGLESFLLPAPCATLLEHIPQKGAVVVIIAHASRCDAIALNQGNDVPLHIHLPNFTMEKAKKYRDELLTTLASHGLRERYEREDSGSEDTEGFDRAGRRARRARARAESNVIGRILKALWIDMVKPIVDELGYSKVGESSAPQQRRIWLCPTGILTFLPIHAAGLYESPDAECLADYAICSYIPTISSLINIAKYRLSTEARPSRLLLTSQPNSPGVSKIPGTTREVDCIWDVAISSGINVLRLDGDALTVDDCLKHMQDFAWVHLACHASQNAGDALRSRFKFHTGNLELGDIVRQKLQTAEFAFLSACQTSTGEEMLPDEAVHLAAGMLAAGYRRVVATMWSISDIHAPSVARDFYKHLLEYGKADEKGVFDASLSAHALHHAIQQLRGELGYESEKSMLTWVPYVHFGN